MTAHVKHVARVLPTLGDDVEEAVKLCNDRAHFVLLVWVDGTVQSISNTPRDELIAVFRHHLRTLETDTLRPGVANGGH